MQPTEHTDPRASVSPLAPRPAVGDLSPSLIREIANDAMGRSDIAAFWFGESDQVTPAFIRDAAIRSLQSGETFYLPNLGRPYLRQALADYLTGLHGRQVGTDRIAVVTAGISGLMLVAQAILSPGDKVVGVAPLWPNVAEIPRILGASVTRVPLKVAHGKWSLDVERLIAALTPGTRMLLLNSPSNPTGWTIEEHEIDAILAHCRRHGIWIIADDVYQRLTYREDQLCAPSFLTRYQDGDRIISVNSFSKSWLMTGFRIGWVVAPPPIIEAMVNLIEFNTCCILEPTQRAAEAALRDGEPVIAGLRAHLRKTRSILERELRALPGVELPDAGGGMYAFFRIAGLDDTRAVVRRLVDEVGLGLAPGDAFGPEGKGWLRWCHAASEAKVLDGIDRFRRFLSK